ncbi:MAG: AbrB/MazE/SpoVT family DNA-binding domain-containing protein [Patescibacteria group bacterium]
MKVVTISSKRQITLPKSFMEVLGLEPNDQAIIRHENRKIIFEPMEKSIVEQTAGSLYGYIHPSKRGASIETIMKVANKAKAKYAAS